MPTPPKNLPNLINYLLDTGSTIIKKLAGHITLNYENISNFLPYQVPWIKAKETLRFTPHRPHRPDLQSVYNKKMDIDGSL